MKFLDWQWRLEGVPDIDKIKSVAKTLIIKSIEVAKRSATKEGVVCTGGFVASCDINDELYLSLSFELTKSEFI